MELWDEDAIRRKDALEIDWLNRYGLGQQRRKIYLRWATKVGSGFGNEV